MAWSHQHANTVRHHEPNETNDARSRNCQSDTQCNQHHQFLFQSLDIYTQVARFLFAKQQRVQCCSVGLQAQCQ